MDNTPNISKSSDRLKQRIYEIKYQLTLIVKCYLNYIKHEKE